METSRAILDNLMGRDRNKRLTQTANRDHYANPDVCKPFLVCFCFNTLFPNTSYDEGVCLKRHDTYLKNMFEADLSRKDHQKEYIKECIKWIQKRLADVEQKTKKNQQSIQNKLNFPSQRPKQVLDRVLAIQEQIEMMIKKAEQYGKAGQIDQSSRYMAEVERLRDNRRQIETVGDSMMSVAKQQKICETCGAIQTINDTSKRIQTHLQGKIHQGFLKLRMEVETLRVRLEMLQMGSNSKENNNGKDNNMYSNNNNSYGSASHLNNSSNLKGSYGSNSNLQQQQYQSNSYQHYYSNLYPAKDGPPVAQRKDNQKGSHIPSNNSGLFDQAQTKHAAKPNQQGQEDGQHFEQNINEKKRMAGESKRDDISSKDHNAVGNAAPSGSKRGQSRQRSSSSKRRRRSRSDERRHNQESRQRRKKHGHKDGGSRDHREHRQRDRQRDRAHRDRDHKSRDHKEYTRKRSYSNEKSSKKKTHHQRRDY